MLFLVVGSSGSGKTTALRELRGLAHVAVHDFDEIGVPRAPVWLGVSGRTRPGRGEHSSIKRAARFAAGRSDAVRELLAMLSATELEAISGCLLDCDDWARLARLHSRGREWVERTGAGVQDYLSWAEWMREHSADTASRGTRRTLVV